jgi:hypothetical protein
MAYYSRVRHFNSFIVFSLAPASPVAPVLVGDKKRHKMPGDVRSIDFNARGNALVVEKTQ